MLLRKSGFLSHASLFVIIGLYAGVGNAFDYPSATNLSDLATIVDEPWTSSALSKLMPPGDFRYNSDLGVITYQNGFDSDFIASLVPATNYDIEMFQVAVIETNTSPRQRFYFTRLLIGAGSVYQEQDQVI